MCFDLNGTNLACRLRCSGLTLEARGQHLPRAPDVLCPTARCFFSAALLGNARFVLGDSIPTHAAAASPGGMSSSVTSEIACRGHACLAERPANNWTQCSSSMMPHAGWAESSLLFSGDQTRVPCQNCFQGQRRCQKLVAEQQNPVTACR